MTSADEKEKMIAHVNYETGECAFSDVPDDLAERVAALLTRILSAQFDAKITFVARKHDSQEAEKRKNHNGEAS